ncbi:MAG: phosphate signaling complex protein PhoU [Proteobacteria bacterium]|nr:phosphate signaling complex protein PhoU [Pseudomonadota bacterium]MBU1739213.1 phosphate signaling complex protein PhoU [Pseudomonadota bacterium]
MATDITKELECLKQKILLLGTTVENNLADALDSVFRKDPSLAEQVRFTDREIDEIEVGVEDDCLSLLALHQPVARDLRFIVTALKINIDLERIGDLAVKIAGKVTHLVNSNNFGKLRTDIPEEIFSELNGMCKETRSMLKQALDAFAKRDVALAYAVILEDDKVDIAKNLIGSCLEKNIKEDPSSHQHLATLLSISRSLERIADHTTNICEDIIYMLQGRIIRHRVDERFEVNTFRL